MNDRHAAWTCRSGDGEPQISQPSLEVATAEAQRRSVETRKLLGEADGKRAYVVRSHLHGMMRETPGKAWVRQALGLGVILSCLLAYLTLLGGRGQVM